VYQEFFVSFVSFVFFVFFVFFVLRVFAMSHLKRYAFVNDS